MSKLFILLLALTLVIESQTQDATKSVGSLKLVARDCFRENRSRLVGFPFTASDPQSVKKMIKCFLIKANLIKDGKFSMEQADIYLNQLRGTKIGITRSQIEVLAATCGNPPGKNDTDAAAEAVADCVVNLAQSLMNQLKNRNNSNDDASLRFV